MRKQPTKTFMMLPNWKKKTFISKSFSVVRVKCMCIADGTWYQKFIHVAVSLWDRATVWLWYAQPISLGYPRSWYRRHLCPQSNPQAVIPVWHRDRALSTTCPPWDLVFVRTLSWPGYYRDHFCPKISLSGWFFGIPIWYPKSHQDPMNPVYKSAWIALHIH